jgi:hypothetical protein
MRRNLNIPLPAMVLSVAVASATCSRTPQPKPPERETAVSIPSCPSANPQRPTSTPGTDAPHEETPSDHSAQPKTQNPNLVQKPTLRLQIGEHLLEVLESGVAGDVILNGTAIVHRDLTGEHGPAAPWADLLRYFGSIPPFEGVVLFSWRGPGNACFGSYGFTFISVRQDGTWERADVPYCAGPPAIITSTPTSVTIRIPPHPPNRGTGTIAGETWVYKNGVVTHIR